MSVEEHHIDSRALRLVLHLSWKERGNASAQLAARLPEARGLRSPQVFAKNSVFGKNLGGAQASVGGLRAPQLQHSTVCLLLSLGGGLLARASSRS